MPKIGFVKIGSKIIGDAKIGFPVIFKGILNILIDGVAPGSGWILATGNWNDSNIWIDSENWID